MQDFSYFLPQQNPRLRAGCGLGLETHSSPPQQGAVKLESAWRRNRGGELVIFITHTPAPRHTRRFFELELMHGSQNACSIEYKSPPSGVQLALSCSRLPTTVMVGLTAPQSRHSRGSLARTWIMPPLLLGAAVEAAADINIAGRIAKLHRHRN